MKIGKFTVSLVDTGIFGLDGGSMFGVVPKSLWQKSYAKPDEKNRIPLAARCLLVSWEGKNILIDTGNGDKWDEKMASIYNIDVEKSNMNKALAPFGISRQNIDAVILTHLHFDHAGGAVIKKGGELEPAFTNAKYYVQKAHLKWAKSPTEKDQGSFIGENFLPLESDGLFEYTDGEGEIFPGISVIPVHGHTKSMQMVKINSEGQTLLFAADLFPTAAHVPYPYILAYDNFPMATLEEKKKFLPQAYEENWIVVFEHDAFKQASHIVPDKKGFVAGDPVIISDKF